MILLDACGPKAGTDNACRTAVIEGMPAAPARLDRRRPSDPELQFSLLVLMSDHPTSGVWLGDYLHAERPAVLANLLELQRQGLCSSGILFDASGPFLARVSRITPRGLAWIGG